VTSTETNDPTLISPAILKTISQDADQAGWEAIAGSDRLARIEGGLL